MTDHGTCRVRLEACNRHVTRHLTLEHQGEGREETYLVCEQHAERLRHVHNVGGWSVVADVHLTE